MQKARKGLEKGREFLAGVIDNMTPGIPGFGYSPSWMLRKGIDKIAGSSPREDTWTYTIGSVTPDIVAIPFGIGAGASAVKASRFSGNLAIHSAHHNFGRWGKLAHIQLSYGLKRVRMPPIRKRIPLPIRRWPKKNIILLRF